MDNDQTPNPLSSSGTGTPPPSGSVGLAYPLRPFVTMPVNSNLTISESSVTNTQPASPPTDSPTSESNPVPINGQPEPLHPTDAPIPASSNSPTQVAPSVNSQPVGSNSSLPTQSSPSSNQTSRLPDEARNTTVTVQAVDPSHLNGESVGAPPPSRGAVIAFGVLTIFFILLIGGLLIWRKRTRSKTGPKDSIGEMEAGLSSHGKPGGSSSAPLSKEQNNNSSSSSEGSNSRGAGAAPSKPFGRPGITRASRPSSLRLDHSRNNRGLPHVDTSIVPTVENVYRPSSWRSSIANAWATLGLPSRLLNDPNGHVWSETTPSDTNKSTRNLIDPSNGILEEPEVFVETGQPDSPPHCSDIVAPPLQSFDIVSRSVLSQETRNSLDTPQSDRQSHLSRHSKSSLVDSFVQPSKDLASSQDHGGKSDRVSVSETESQPSPVTTNEAAQVSPKSSLMEHPQLKISDVTATKLTGTPTPKPLTAKIKVDKMHPSNLQTELTLTPSSYQNHPA